MKRLAVIGLHAGYWGIYFLLILLFDLMASLTAHHHFVPVRFWWVFWHNPAWIFLVVPAVLAFYTFYTLLFSRFLQKKRLLLLLVSAAGVCLCSAVIAILLLKFGFGTPFGFSLDTGAAILFLSVIALVNGVLGLVMKGFITWYGEIRLKEELRRQNAEMELALIKSQLNPHFLFNTLNNIDVLIGRDPVRASGYLKKLSDILRFMLYETKTAQIPIATELGYIEKYIELQRIRTANPDAIDYIVEGQPGQWMVEPMLFIPFIENAFKHGQWRAKHSIRIRFVLDDEKIVFNCENACHTVSPGVCSGLGDGLIRKRLSLLYPDRHTLEINAAGDLYTAKLTLSTHAN